MMKLQTLVRPAYEYAFAAACTFLVLVGSSYEVVHGHTKRIIEVLAVVGVTFLCVSRRGVFVGVLVLVALNGIPFFDASHRFSLHITYQDVGCIVLIATGLISALAARTKVKYGRAVRALSVCGLLLVLWCAFTVGRSWGDGSTPLLGAVRFGRDFMYFGALLVVLPRIRLSNEDVREMFWVLGVALVLFSVGQIVTVEGIANPTWLVHASSTAHTLGLTRVYSPMNDLLFAGVAFAIATIALSRGLWQKRAIPIAALLTVSLVLQLTRARWIAMIVSIVLISAWMALQADRRTAAVLRRRLTLALALLVATIVGVLLVAPHVFSSGAVADRLLSIFSDVQSSAGTLATRQQVANAMTTLLGSHWPIGLGLISPSVHFYPTLPVGSLRNPDVGVLNAVMTIGAIGAAFIYLPLIVMLAKCMRFTRLHTPKANPWIGFGGQIWIVAALASSVTLITLFSVGGLALAAFILTILARYIDDPGPMSKAETESPPGAVSLSRMIPERIVPPRLSAPALAFPTATPRRARTVGALRPTRIDHGSWPADPARPVAFDRTYAVNRRLTVLTLSLAALAAILGVLLAHTLVGPGSSPTPANLEAANAAVQFQYPSAWEQQPVPTEPVLRLQSELAVGPGGRGVTRTARVVVGVARSTDASLLPAELRGGLTHLGQPTTVVLDGLRFLRYRDQAVTGLSGSTSLYALPTSAGTIVAVCETPAGDPSFAAQCERIVATARPVGASVTALPQDPAYANALPPIMRGLAADTGADLRTLRSARTSKAQAAAASGIAGADIRAAAALTKLSAGQAKVANEAFASALRGEGAAYAALARAATRHDARAYAAAGRAVQTAETKVTLAADALAKLDYSVG